mmetsp:Transcript_69977/g.186501  ORF Transcript_69977/g.186501 Transcript_69977/m.186501 type:complete len:881 (+) Transcript_69977:1-2643(+)
MYEQNEALQRSLEQSAAQLQRHADGESFLHGEVERLEQVVHEHEQARGTAEQALAETKQGLAGLQGELDKALAEVANLQTHLLAVRQASSEADSLAQREAADCRARIAELEQALAAAASSYSQVTTEFETAKRQSVSSAGQATLLQTDLEHWKREAEGERRNRQAFEESAASTQTELRSLREELSAMTCTLEGAAEKEGRLCEEIDAKNKQAAQREAELQTQKGELCVWQERLEKATETERRLRGEVEAKHQQAEGHQEAAAVASRRVAQLNEAVGDAERQVGVWKQLHQEEVGKTQSVQQEIVTYEDRIKELRLAVEDAQTQARRWQSTHAAVEDEHAQESRKRKLAASELADATAAASSLRQQLGDARERADTHFAELEKSRQQLAAVHASAAEHQQVAQQHRWRAEEFLGEAEQARAWQEEQRAALAHSRSEGAAHEQEIQRLGALIQRHEADSAREASECRSLRSQYAEQGAELARLRDECGRQETGTAEVLDGMRARLEHARAAEVKLEMEVNAGVVRLENAEEASRSVTEALKSARDDTQREAEAHRSVVARQAQGEVEVARYAELVEATKRQLDHFHTELSVALHAKDLLTDEYSEAEARAAAARVVADRLQGELLEARRILRSRPEQDPHDVDVAALQRELDWYQDEHMKLVLSVQARSEESDIARQELIDARLAATAAETSASASREVALLEAQASKDYGAQVRARNDEYRAMVAELSSSKSPSRQLNELASETGTLRAAMADLAASVRSEKLRRTRAEGELRTQLHKEDSYRQLLRLVLDHDEGMRSWCMRVVTQRQALHDLLASAQEHLESIGDNEWARALSSRQVLPMDPEMPVSLDAAVARAGSATLALYEQVVDGQLSILSDFSGL